MWIRLYIDVKEKVFGIKLWFPGFLAGFRKLSKMRCIRRLETVQRLQCDGSTPLQTLHLWQTYFLHQWYAPLTDKVNRITNAHGGQGLENVD